MILYYILDHFESALIPQRMPLSNNSQSVHTMLHVFRSNIVISLLVYIVLVATVAKLSSLRKSFNGFMKKLKSGENGFQPRGTLTSRGRVAALHQIPPSEMVQYSNFELLARLVQLVCLRWRV